MPGLNELLAGSRNAKGSWNAYNQLKAKWMGQIRLQARSEKPVGPAFFTFLFVEPDRRRDPDNLTSAGIKLIFDSLVEAEVLAGDGWAHVLGFTSYWQTGDSPGCLVKWDDRQVFSKPAMQGALENRLEENAKQKSRR